MIGYIRFRLFLLGNILYAWTHAWQVRRYWRRYDRLERARRALRIDGRPRVQIRDATVGDQHLRPVGADNRNFNPETRPYVDLPS